MCPLSNDSNFRKNSEALSFQPNAHPTPHPFFFLVATSNTHAGSCDGRAGRRARGGARGDGRDRGAVGLVALAWWALAYVVGATCAQALFLVVHETAHDLAWPSTRGNKAVALIANLPLVSLRDRLPQGVPPRPPRACTCAARLRPADEWRCATRPRAVRPPRLVPARGVRAPSAARAADARARERSVAVGQRSAQAAVVLLSGRAALAYWLASAFLAGGLHLTAGHFLAEHYDLAGKGAHATLSYYGAWNALTSTWYHASTTRGRGAGANCRAWFRPSGVRAVESRAVVASLAGHLVRFVCTPHALRDARAA